MAITINTNSIASQASLNVSRASNLLHKSLTRLSSGQRIVSPADDAGGLAVGMKLQSALRRTKATQQNIQNGVSYLQVQDGALKVFGSILDRMAELKSYYNDISKNDSDRDNYNHEFSELQKQLGELKQSKFNGVSLFATTEPDGKQMQIITTEDGVTGQVGLNRTGLFENMKSKFGADSVLNTGSSGSYRQLVGEYTIDGVNPATTTGTKGAITQDYAPGDVIYYDGQGTPANAGYFQVLPHNGTNDVVQVSVNGVVMEKLLYNPGTAKSIVDSGGAASNFIRVGNPQLGGAGTAAHEGFAEVYQNAEKYSASRITYPEGKSGPVGYVQDEVVKVSISSDADGPGYRFFKVNWDNSTVKTNGGTTAGAMLDNEWIEVGQRTAYTVGTPATAGYGRILEPSRANGSRDLDGDGTNDGVTLERGDKIYHQGDYYAYVSINNSAHASLDGYGPSTEDGYTNMDDLIAAGAVVKLNVYVDDQPRGGSPDADANAFYPANTNLAFVDRLPDSGMVRTNTIVRSKNTTLNTNDGIHNSGDDNWYKGLHSGNDGIYGTTDDYYSVTSSQEIAKQGYHIDADADNNKDLLNTEYDLSNFSVADFVDYIQTLANARAVNGGTMSRLNYAEEILEENHTNLEAATGRIMDADMALESTKFARQNVLVQAGAAMVVQANQLSNIVLALLA